VEKEDDELINVRERGRSGWFSKKDAVLMENAIAYFTGRIRQNEKDARAYLCRGAAWTERGMYTIAIQVFTEVIRLEPDAPGGFYNRGLAWHLKKDNDRAIKDYDEAIRLDPTYPAAFNNRGNAWWAKKDFDPAIKDHSESIRLDPKKGTAFNIRGSVWRAKMDYDRAIKDYSEAIRLAPKEAWPHFNLSATRMLMRRSEAVAGFQRVLDLQGRNGDRSSYAVILGHLGARLMGDGTAAKRFLKDSTARLDESWPYPVVQFLRDEIDEPAVLKVADNVGKRTEARCYLGLDRALKNRKDEALAHFRWVKEHGDPTFVEYAIALAELERLERPSSGSKPE
jgi:tetratricopeptide (TPR) repeat protein